MFLAPTKAQGGEKVEGKGNNNNKRQTERTETTGSQVSCGASCGNFHTARSNFTHLHSKTHTAPPPNTTPFYPLPPREEKCRRIAEVKEVVGGTKQKNEEKKARKGEKWEVKCANYISL